MLGSQRIISYERAEARIDLDAVLHNMDHMKASLSCGTKMMAVIKTDGYGHGSIAIAKELETLEYVYGYAVATPEEAFLLRENHILKPILILGYTFPEVYGVLHKMEVRPAVFTREMLADLAAVAKEDGRPVKIHIKVDSGMGRIGIMPNEEGIEFIREAKKYVQAGTIEIEGIFTHFARADERDKTSAWEQFSLFSGFVERAEKELGFRIPLHHCSNSAGILEMPGANMDLVRAGITMYGLHPSEEVPAGESYLKPVMTLHSEVIYVKTVHAGQSISYGGTFTATKDMRVATIPVGYGDGYPRTLSGGKGYVLIHGRRAAILGRICMDQFMVDVTDIPETEVGTPVTLLGTDGEETITAELLGALSGRFHYELVCDFSRRIPRTFWKQGRLVGIQDMLDGYLEVK